MRRRPPDFVQLTYNIVDREAERRLLPLALERGIAVICNRPFQRGRLPDWLAGRPMPGWAQEIGVSTWPQFLLKFILSHPAVTAAIPRNPAYRPFAREQVRRLRPRTGRSHAPAHGGACAEPVGPFR